MLIKCIVRILDVFPWRGNIRELNRAARRAITNCLSRGATEIEREDFDLLDMDEGSGVPVSEIRKNKKENLRDALKKHKGNVSHAANTLGVSRVTIHSWVKSEKIDLDSFRK